MTSSATCSGRLLTLTGEGFSDAELEEVAEDVRDEILLIAEVAKVDIYGAQEERIFVEYNNARLAELGVSPFQLQELLQSQNIIFPGGEVRTSYEEIVLEPSGNFESVEGLSSTVIRLPGRDDLMYLGDLADVYRGYIDPPRTRMHASGTCGLALAVSLREGGNISLLGEKIQTLVADLESQFPYGITFDFAALQSIHVNRKVDDFVGNLLQAIFLVLAVMLVSLGIRTGLVVASLVPMAMITAVLVMSFLEIGLDQMSLAALIIALGMLVDNAIVMSESIHGADGVGEEATRRGGRLGARASSTATHLLGDDSRRLSSHLSRRIRDRRIYGASLQGDLDHAHVLLAPRAHDDAASLRSLPESETVL